MRRGIAGSARRLVDQGRFRIGLRVAEVAAAAEFYRGFGLSDVDTIPATDGAPLMNILEREGARLILDSLQGMPFRDDERERRTQAGPRGLGVAIGSESSSTTSMPPTSTAGPTAARSAPSPPMSRGGDRVFECLNPFGYLLEISQPMSDVRVDHALAITGKQWPDASM